MAPGASKVVQALFLPRQCPLCFSQLLLVYEAEEIEDHDDVSILPSQALLCLDPILHWSRKNQFNIVSPFVCTAAHGFHISLTACMDGLLN
jgi:hypothetical protein